VRGRFGDLEVGLAFTDKREHPHLTFAQQAPPAEAQAVRTELDRLRTELDALRQRYEGELATLTARLTALETAGAAPGLPGPTATPATAAPTAGTPATVPVQATVPGEPQGTLPDWVEQRREGSTAYVSFGWSGRAVKLFSVGLETAERAVSLLPPL